MRYQWRKVRLSGVSIMSHTGNVTGNYLGNFAGHGSANYSKNDLWSPDTANMVFWWDTLVDSSVVLSGNLLIALKDLSGKNINLDQSGAPSWDSNNKIATFNGSSQGLVSTATVRLALNSDFTLITLLNPASSQATINTPLDIEHGLSGGSGPLVLQNEAARPSVNNYYFAWFNSSNAAQNIGPPFVSMSANSWTLAVMGKTGAVANAFINGSQAGSFPVTSSSGLTDLAKRVSVARTIFNWVGTGGSRWWAGSFASAILFNQSLSLSEIQKLEGYMLWSRGWQSNLPASHPYRNRAPLIGD